MAFAALTMREVPRRSAPSLRKSSASCRLALLVAAVLAIIFGAVRGHVFFVVLGVLYVSLGWIALCGLRVLKPQEALVLTLFGKYVGTLKGEGFY